MVIGLALALAAITWGSVLLIQRIERVVIQFEQASHELFAEWLSLRPATLKGAAVGTQEGTPGALGRLEFIFVECSDVSEPRMVSIDVRKTDSVLSPFLGIIHVETNESCVRRPVWASGWVGKDKQEALIAACVGKPYDECIAARGKPMAKRLDRPFSYSGHLTIFYRRSKGQWMFDREDSAEPKAVETSGT